MSESKSVWTILSGTRDGYEEHGSGGPGIESVWSTEALAMAHLNHLADYWKYSATEKWASEKYRISPDRQRFITIAEYELDPPN